MQSQITDKYTIMVNNFDDRYRYWFTCINSRSSKPRNAIKNNTSLPAIFCIFQDIIRIEWSSCKIFGNLTNCINCIPLTSSMQKLFNIGISPFQIYESKYGIHHHMMPMHNVNYKRIISHILDSRKYVVVFIKIFIIYHEWYLENYSIQNDKLLIMIKHIGSTKNIPQDVIDIIFNYCFKNKIYDYLLQDDIYKSICNIIQNSFFLKQLAKRHNQGDDIWSGVLFKFMMKFNISNIEKSKLFDVLFRTVQYKNQIEIMKHCWNNPNILNILCKSKYLQRQFTFNSDFSKNDIYILLKILYLCIKYKWYEKEIEWNNTLNQSGYTLILLCYIMKYHLCSEYKWFSLTKKDYLYLNEIFNYYVKQTENDKDYWINIGVYTLEKFLILLLIILNDENLIKNDIEMLINSLYSSIKRIKINGIITYHEINLNRDCIDSTLYDQFSKNLASHCSLKPTIYDTFEPLLD